MSEAACYFLSALAIAQEYTGENLTAEQILSIKDDMIACGALSPNMRVNNPDTIANAAFDALGLNDVTATVGWGGNGTAADMSIILGTTALNNDHYQLGDTDGNLVWDPYTNDLDLVNTQVRLVYIHD
jgi:hypothetical protein